MNPHLHDEFVALSALFYSGEISDEEWALLQVHLAYCDSCRTNFEQFQQVTSEVIPAMAGAEAAEHLYLEQESNASLWAAESRLMARLDAVAPSSETSKPRTLPWPIIGVLIAACAVFLACLVGVHLSRISRPLTTKAVPAIPTAPPLNRSAASIQTSVAATSPAALDEKVAELQRQLRIEKDLSSRSDDTVAKLERQLQTEQAQLEQIGTEKDVLIQQLAADRAEAQSLQAKADSLKTIADQQAAHVAMLDGKVLGLNAALLDRERALDDKDRILSLDKDFLAHDRDIRDLIGARNLYIADIFDMGENGQTAKPFGRIFYTKERSLVFYGFDLDKQAGLKQSATFQVWGSGSDKQAVNLGLFYQDDSHKRWVLRCDDAKALARLNMVFVTVEPPGGSSRPTGKQLLRAYLQIDPNHP